MPAAMKTRAVRRRRWLRAERQQDVDHQCRRQHALHGDGGDRARRRARAGSAPSSSTPTIPGFSYGEKERKLGIKGSPTREIYFDDCRIPADRMIGDPGTGFTTALRTLDHTRLGIGAQAVGIAQGALDVAIGYIKQRRQFGQPVSDFQGVQFMVADMAMKIEAARQLVYRAASAGRDAARSNLTFTSSAAKCFASDTAMSVTVDAVQLLGGYGYVERLPGRAHDARREDHPDLRGHQPDPAHGDGTAAAEMTRREMTRPIEWSRVRRPLRPARRGWS